MSGVFDPNTYIKTVTIVGCGGTGAQVARIVGRMAYDMQRSRKHAPQIVLIDPDTVEEKNVGRQLFSPSLLGKNKAACVGRMLNLALGLVISCVDNHEARREIHRANGILIGAGNHTDSGQVCIGNADDPDLVRRFINGRDGKYPYLPKEGLLFPELLQPEPPHPTPESTASCAERVAEGSQHLLVNDMIATVVGQYVYKLLHRQPIHTFLTYISIGELPSSRSLPICREELEVFLEV